MKISVTTSEVNKKTAEIGLFFLLVMCSSKRKQKIPWLIEI